jgi:hypothetical protein
MAAIVELGRDPYEKQTNSQASLGRFSLKEAELMRIQSFQSLRKEICHEQHP